MPIRRAVVSPYSHATKQKEGGRRPPSFQPISNRLLVAEYREGEVGSHAGVRYADLRGCPSRATGTESILRIFPHGWFADLVDVGAPVPFAADIEGHVHIRGNPAVFAARDFDAATRHVNQERAAAAEVAVALTRARFKDDAHALLDLLVEDHGHRVGRAGPPEIAEIGRASCR